MLLSLSTMVLAGIVSATLLLAQAASPPTVWPPPPATAPSYGTTTEGYQPPTVGSQ